MTPSPNESAPSMRGRIWFAGNPWPAGHAVIEASFGIALGEAGAGLLLHLRSEDYDVVEIPDDDAVKDDWLAPIVWGNYHACILSNTYWGIERATLPQIAGDPRVLLNAPSSWHIDPIGADHVFDSGADAFHIYLLGHDAVRDHRIAIRPTPAGAYDIDWQGRIALAYAGETDYRYRFVADLRDVPFDGFVVLDGTPEQMAARHLGGMDGLQIERGRGSAPDRLTVR